MASEACGQVTSIKQRYRRSRRKSYPQQSEERKGGGDDMTELFLPSVGTSLQKLCALSFLLEAYPIDKLNKAFQ
jgi:hypothetical protein